MIIPPSTSALNVPIASTDFPLSILSNWFRTARHAHKELPIGEIALRPKWTAQASVAVSGNHQLAMHFPWEIPAKDFSQLYVTNPIPTPNSATWGQFNSGLI